MTHAPRDLGRLRALVDRLDRHALALKRAITLPLVREYLQSRAPGRDGADGDLA
jgi:chromosomal replication initiation ATPase DnaA